MESILTSIKKLLGIEEENIDFDIDIIMHINSVLMFLCQAGVGPETGFSISDKTKTWADYLGAETNLEGVKTYIFLKVKKIFDPPTIASVLEAMQQMITEFEWRLNIQADESIPIVPEEPLDPEGGVF